MIEPTLPPDEAGRLAALRELEILDTPSDPAFDQLTALAADLFDVPIALISLVDDDRQWFKSCYGLNAQQTGRDVSFCGHAIHSDEVMIVADALADPRFADNPLVRGEPYIRFYSGAPIIRQDRHRLGTLCLIDSRPRPEFGAKQAERQQALARLTMHQLEAHLANRQLQAENDRARRTELEAASARAQLEAALEIIPDAFVFYDSDDRLVICNSNYRAFYPRSADLLVPGTRFEDIVRTGARRGEYTDAIGREEAWVAERLDHHRNPGEPVIQQLTDGRWLRVAERRTPGGDTVGIRMDITDLKRTEEKLRLAMEQAEAASRFKSNFLATMSHEIRTPMHGVLGMLSLLEDTQLTEAQQSMISTVRGSAEALLTIINDVLDFSKLEAGRLELQNAEFDLVGAVTDGVELLASPAHQKGLEIGASFAADVPMRVIGDIGRFRQILLNLVGNAVKFTDSGGVEVHVSSIATAPGQIRVRLEVLDTGIGIQDDVREDLFGEFTQLDPSYTRRHSGTGLGLAICRQLVSLMAGDIGVRRRRDGGSAFWCEVMLETVGTQAPIDRRSQLAAGKAIVVDPNPVGGRLLERQLKAGGWQVISTTGIEVATELAEAKNTPRQHPDVVIIDESAVAADMSAPGLLSETPGTKRVLAIRASTPRRIERWNQAGFDAYVVKPTRQSALLERLSDLIDPALGPRAAPEAPAATSPSPDFVLSAGGPATSGGLAGPVLLAEDSETNIRVARTMLAKAGIEADVVRDGEATVRAALSTDYPLILMDVAMPRMDGLQATRTIRAAGGPRSRVPIIAMTANVAAEYRDQCLDAGMSDFLGKPFTAMEIVSIVGKYLGPGIVGAEPEPDRKPTVDTAPLDQLIADIGPDVLVRLVDIFLDESRHRLERMAGATQRPTSPDLARDVHTFKNGAATFGLVGLHRLIVQLEQHLFELNAGTNGSIGPAGALVEQVLADAPAALAWLERHVRALAR